MLHTIYKCNNYLYLLIRSVDDKRMDLSENKRQFTLSWTRGLVPKRIIGVGTKSTLRGQGKLVMGFVGEAVSPYPPAREPGGVL